MNTHIRGLLFIIALILEGFSVKAADYYSVTNGDFFGAVWSTVSHLDPACACRPDADAACDIIVPANTTIHIAHVITTTCNISIGSNATIIVESGGSLVVAGNGGISGTGNFYVNAGGSVDVSGDFNISGNGDAIVNGTMNVGGTLTFSGGGELCGTGNLNVGGLAGGTPCATIVLPIELLSFDATSLTDRVLITWVTSTETLNDYFTVERSRDGINFEEVARVNGAGNSTQIIEYAVTDYSPLPGVSYYRLQQTNTNGSKEIFNSVVVSRSAVSHDVNIYPNPAVAGEPIFFNFTGFGDEEVLVVVRDISGKEFYSKVILIKDKNQLVAFDTEQRIPSGTYVVIASSNDHVYSKKIIVQ